MDRPDLQADEEADEAELPDRSCASAFCFPNSGITTFPENEGLAAWLAGWTGSGVICGLRGGIGGGSLLLATTEGVNLPSFVSIPSGKFPLICGRFSGIASSCSNCGILSKSIVGRVSGLDPIRSDSSTVCFSGDFWIPDDEVVEGVRDKLERLAVAPFIEELESCVAIGKYTSVPLTATAAVAALMTTVAGFGTSAEAGNFDTRAFVWAE